MENLSLNVWSNRNNHVLTLILSLSSELPPKPFCSIVIWPVFGSDTKGVVRSNVGMFGMTAPATALLSKSPDGMTFGMELQVAEIAVQGAPLTVSKP